jgi:hypothetical protein
MRPSATAVDPAVPAGTGPAAYSTVTVGAVLTVRVDRRLPRYAAAVLPRRKRRNPAARPAFVRLVMAVTASAPFA